MIQPMHFRGFFGSHGNNSDSDRLNHCEASHSETSTKHRRSRVGKAAQILLKLVVEHFQPSLEEHKSWPFLEFDFSEKL